MREDEINARSGLKILLGSQEVGPCLVEDKDHNFYIFNHFEYDSHTLKEEYDVMWPLMPKSQSL